MKAQLYRYRHYWIITLSVLAFLVCYAFGFKRTFAAWQLHKRLQKQELAGNDLTLQPAFVERQHEDLKKLIHSYKIDTADFRTNLLNKLAMVADSTNVSLADVPTEKSYEQVIEQRVIVNGKFFDLLTFYTEIEKSQYIGHVRSARWYSERKKENSSVKLDILIIAVK